MILGCTTGTLLSILLFKRRRLKLSLRTHRPGIAVGTSVSSSRLLGANRWDRTTHKGSNTSSSGDQKNSRRLLTFPRSYPRCLRGRSKGGHRAACTLESQGLSRLKSSLNRRFSVRQSRQDNGCQGWCQELRCQSPIPPEDDDRSDAILGAQDRPISLAH